MTQKSVELLRLAEVPRQFFSICISTEWEHWFIYMNHTNNNVEPKKESIDILARYMVISLMTFAFSTLDNAQK